MTQAGQAGQVALICGISGQDGAYLARLLLDKGYHVVGTSRDAQVARLDNLDVLGVRAAVALDSMVPTDFRSVLQALRRHRPDEVYFLAGQTSVGLSFEQPVETLDSISMGTLNLLEAIRFSDRPIRFYNAGSSECFGDTGDAPATEDTPFRPRSPYAVAKAAALWTVANYREAYGVHASSGILFNHESPLRPARFVTRKIIATAARIAAGQPLRLALGNMHVWRDWGYAPEYVQAMWLLLQQPQPGDYLVCTGESRSLQDFVERAFSALGLDWREHTDVRAELMRPTDLAISRGNPARIERELGWRAQTHFAALIDRLVAAERAAPGD